MSDKELTADIYDVIGYMLASAKELVVDPKLYGPFRLVDAVSRLITLLDSQGQADQFLLSLRDDIEEDKFCVMTDEEQFKSFLNALVVKMAEATCNRGI